MRRFLARIQFYLQRTLSRPFAPGALLEGDFKMRPYFDEVLGRPNGYTEVLIEDGRVFMVAKSHKRFHSKPDGNGKVIPLHGRRRFDKVKAPNSRAA